MRWFPEGRSVEGDGPALDVERLRELVGAVEDPDLGMTLADAGTLEQLTIAADGRVLVVVAVPSPEVSSGHLLEARVRERVARLEPRRQAEISRVPMTAATRMRVGQLLRQRREADRLAGRARVYAVASGKGGVGKSTVTANLAVALARSGQRVAVLDADVWGYSVPQQFGVRDAPVAMAGIMLPLHAWGVQLMSVGFFVTDDEPVMWRGPMLHKAIEQFVGDVAWADLDVLLVDLPPGTGDVQLSLIEQLPGANFLVVTTPQPAAADVAARVGRMALDARIPVAGVVENMAGVTCGHCGTLSDVFGAGGGAELARSLDVPLLASIPLDSAARVASDAGRPVVESSPDSPSARAFAQLAAALPHVRPSLVGRSLPLTVVE